MDNQLGCSLELGREKRNRIGEQRRQFKMTNVLRQEYVLFIWMELDYAYVKPEGNQYNFSHPH